MRSSNLWGLAWKARVRRSAVDRLRLHWLLRHLSPVTACSTRTAISTTATRPTPAMPAERATNPAALAASSAAAAEPTAASNTAAAVTARARYVLPGSATVVAAITTDGAATTSGATTTAPSAAVAASATIGVTVATAANAATVASAIGATASTATNTATSRASSPTRASTELSATFSTTFALATTATATSALVANCRVRGWERAKVIGRGRCCMRDVPSRLAWHHRKSHRPHLAQLRAVRSKYAPATAWADYLHSLPRAWNRLHGTGSRSCAERVVRTSPGSDKCHHQPHSCRKRRCIRRIRLRNQVAQSSTVHSARMHRPPFDQRRKCPRFGGGERSTA